MQASRREALLKEYGEVNANFRLLTDIRFKLLSLLPIAAAAAAGLKGESFGVVGFVLSMFGLTVTLAVASYNARNDQLYDELVGRAAAIERSLGLPDGGFANRPRAWLRYSGWTQRWKVEHRDAVAAVYAASCALWSTGVLAPVFELARVAYLRNPWPYLVVERPEPLVVVLAAFVSIWLVWYFGRIIRSQRGRQEVRLRVNARRAVHRATGRPMQQIAMDEILLDLCQRLAGAKKSVVRRRALFYANLQPEGLRHFLLPGPPVVVAAQAISLLTDLPGRWLLDCATNRRGLQKFSPSGCSVAHTEA